MDKKYQKMYKDNSYLNPNYINLYQKLLQINNISIKKCLNNLMINQILIIQKINNNKIQIQKNKPKRHH